MPHFLHKLLTFRSRSAIRKVLPLANLVVCKVNHCNGSFAISITFPDGFKFSYSGDCRPSQSFAAIGFGSTVLVHEATFDDELRGDAVAKKHSTISEAINVGIDMRARNLVLTHFSQRFSKLPSMAEVRKLGQNLPKTGEEDAEGDEDELQPLEQDIQSEPQSSSKPEIAALKPNLGKGRHQETLQATSISKTDTSANEVDMKIGVAFDYMTVRVRDIQHLENFTPAIMQLYNEEELVPSAETRSDSIDKTGSATPSQKTARKQKGRPGKPTQGGGHVGTVEKARSAANENVAVVI